jgi:hypothetical protein
LSKPQFSVHYELGNFARVKSTEHPEYCPERVPGKFGDVVVLIYYQQSLP